jgi:hypothetical protein
VFRSQAQFPLFFKDFESRWCSVLKLNSYCFLRILKAAEVPFSGSINSFSNQLHGEPACMVYQLAWFTSLLDW